MNYKVQAIAKTKEKANSHEVLVDLFGEKNSEIDERDEIFQDRQHIPQSSASMLDLRTSQEAAYVARRKDSALSPASCTGTGSSISPHSKLFSNPSTPRSSDPYGHNTTPLIPVTLTSPAGRIIRSQRSVEWMHLKPTGMDDSARIQPSSKFISENERILSSFDPMDDVVFMPKSKGGGGNLEASDITKNQVKAMNEPGNDESSILIPGIKEMQFQTLKERCQGDITSRKVEHTVDKTPQTRPKISLETHTQEALAKIVETPVINKPSPSVPPTVNLSAKEKQAKVTKASQNMPNRVPKASHRISSPTALRSRGSKATASPMVISPKEPSRLEEPELHHKKSIRFCDVLTSNPMKPESQATKVDVNKPLVSILKSTPAEPLTHLSDNNRIYNYEYIREVVVYNLPNDITLSSLLRQVRGGLLEKALIDSYDLSARLVFVEPEAARRFYNHIHRIGFFVHTEIPAAQFSLKERLIQCNLRGFIWTNHSCEIPVHMIQNIWKHGITRCLIISNFPRDIGVMRLIEDVMELLGLPAVETKYIIEGTSTDRDLSSTSVFVRIGFSCIQYAFRVGKDLSTYSPLYSRVSVSYDKDPCGGLISNEPPSCWTGGKEIGNDKPAVPSPAIKSQALNRSAPLACTAAPKKPTTNVRADIVALWNQFDDKSQPVPVEKLPGNPHATASAPPVADISIAFKGFSIPKKKTRKSPGESNPNIAPDKIIPQKAQIEKSAIQDTPSPAMLEQITYDNWGVGLSTKASQPPLGAHWNYGGQEVAREYNEAITKKARRMPEALNIPDEKPKIENIWPEPPLIDRIVHLKNLPRTFHVARLFRFIRGGMVEHVDLKPPNSEYNTSSAIIVFVDPDSVKSYQSYLKSPGLTVEMNQRVVFAENIRPDIVENIRSLGHHGSRTRCLHIESLPNGTMLGEFLGIIEGHMNHSNLEFEHAAVRKSKDGGSEAFLRLLSIGTAVFVAQVLERSYTGITITYDRDPCEGSVEELDEVNLELR
jgi:hypothetical protein